MYSFTLSIILPMTRRIALSSPQVSAVIHIDLINIKMGEREASIDKNYRHVLSKEISITGFSVAMSTIDMTTITESIFIGGSGESLEIHYPDYITVDEYIAYATSKKSDSPTALVVGPVQVMSAVHLYQDTLSGIYNCNSSVNISPISLVISKSSFKVLERLNYIAGRLSARDKYHSFIPMVPRNSREPGNYAKWWRFACDVIQYESRKKESMVAQHYVNEALCKEFIAFMVLFLKGSLGDALDGSEMSTSLGSSDRSEKFLFGVSATKFLASDSARIRKIDENRIIQVIDSLSIREIFECTMKAVELVYPGQGYENRLSRFIRAQLAMKSDPSKRITLNMLIEERAKDKEQDKRGSDHRYDDGVFNGVVFKTLIKISKLDIDFSLLPTILDAITISMSDILVQQEMEQGFLNVGVNVGVLNIGFRGSDICSFGKNVSHGNISEKRNALSISFCKNIANSSLGLSFSKVNEQSLVVNFNNVALFADHRLKDFLEFNRAISNTLDPKNVEIECLQKDIDLISIKEKEEFLSAETSETIEAFRCDVLRKRLRPKERYVDLCRRYGIYGNALKISVVHSEIRKKLKNIILHKYGFVVEHKKFHNVAISLKVNNLFVSVANDFTKFLELNVGQISGQYGIDCSPGVRTSTKEDISTTFVESYNLNMEDIGIFISNERGVQSRSILQNEWEIKCTLQRNLFESSPLYDDINVSCECSPFQMELPYEVSYMIYNLNCHFLTNIFLIIPKQF